MKSFTVKSSGLEFIVLASDWYNAIQVAYEKYLAERKTAYLISYMTFRDYCSVNLNE